ncbi:hypothetical protein Bca101_068652 [Brassica carinata]
MAMLSTPETVMNMDGSASACASASPEVVVSDPSPSSPDGSRSSGSPDRTSSPSPSRGGENQSEVISRSEEYRQLFRLPADEVLVQDFNCACQESILLQGHMYLFIHYICFYSNIFGYETKKIIPFADISCVKRAKTAGIFPNAIEILAGGKKYFFASFLSRDEAFKLIHDGWVEYGCAVKSQAQIQDSFSESNNQVNDGVVQSTLDLASELDSPSRDETPRLSGSSSVPVITQNGVSPSSVNLQRHTEPLVDTVASSSTNILNSKPEDLNAPKCSAKFGGCQESQKFRMYRDSHLVIETSQEITDVPYADYFTVEGVWDVKRDCKDSIEGSILDVYVNLAFSKRTVWKGKIVQSTLEECREAYAAWIRMAHELLKQKKLENQEGIKLSEDGAVSSASEERVSECEEQRVEIARGRGGGVVNILRESLMNVTSFVKRQSSTKQALVIAFAVILLMQVTIVVLLKRGPEQVQMGSEYYSSYDKSGIGESVGWLEKRMHFLREEMIMVEDRLQRMRQDHAALKAQLHQLERLLLRHQQ